MNTALENGIYKIRENSGGGTTITKIICSSAADTPAGISWTSGGSTIIGTLAASASLKDNIYLVPGKKTRTGNQFTEYSCVLYQDSYVWEQTGSADLDPSVVYGYLNAGTFYLTRTGSEGSYVYSDAVTPVANKQYVDNASKHCYLYENSAFVQLINGLTKGNNTLTPGHILVTDSDGNVADSGKTTADLQDVIYGYMNNSTFYLTRTGSAGAYVYSDAVTPAQNKQYTDKEGNVPYVWDGSAYHAIGGGSTPQNEVVSFNISSSDGQASLTGQQIIINISGQANPTLVTLDANGQGSATVALGTPYSVAYPAITGYTKPLDGDYIAMTNARSIVRTYNKIDLLNLTASVHVEESSSPLWTLGGNPQIVENILNRYGSYVIDEVNKKYARLSPADHSKFLDGTAWTGSYGNSFRRFPRVYYKFDTSTKFLYISDSLFDDNVKHWDETWIGTYKGSVQSNILRSIPGVNTTGNMNMTAFWEAAQRQGGDYGLVNYFDHCLLNALHLCKYGNANSQQTMGGGLQDAGSSYYTHQTGTTKLLGDNTGSAQYLSTNFTMCKLFGIEDLAGSQWEFRPNIRFSGTDCIVYEGNIVSNTAPGIREAFSRNTGLSQSYIVAMALGEYFDLISITGGGSSSSNWCDGAWSSTSGQLLLVGGTSNGGSICGLSASDSTPAFSLSSANIGARLAFRGDISDYDLVTGSELAALH